MSDIIYTDGFAGDFMTVERESKQNEILHRIETLATLPELGSPKLTEYIERTYGKHVRKLVVNPFDVIYEYDEETQEVRILALLHQRAAW